MWLVAALYALTADTPTCQQKTSLDFNGGDIGAHNGTMPGPVETMADRCCTLCASTHNCWVSVLSASDAHPPHECWLKSKAALSHAKANPGVISLWPDGHFPVPIPAPTPRPPPSPPPPTVPQCYEATLLAFDKKPVLSHVDGSSTFGQVFNPSWIEASPGTGGKSGLLVRTQDCDARVGGSCIACAGTGPKASVLTFSELLGTDNTTTTPEFAPITSASVVFGPHNGSDVRGTEDPRIVFDHTTRLYYMFYTCWGDEGAVLCLATTRNPTAAGSWTRHGQQFPGSHKSGALLIRETGPHYLISGAGQIHIAQSDNLLNWTLGPPFISKTLWGNPNVEAGPPPMRLADGNYVFFHNSWGGRGVPKPGYQPAWVVLDGTDPTKILARAPHSLFTPTDEPWMEGIPPYTCNVPQVAFLEAAHPAGDDTYRVYFGGSDAVVGTALVFFRKVPGVACESR